MVPGKRRNPEVARSEHSMHLGLATRKSLPPNSVNRKCRNYPYRYRYFAHVRASFVAGLR